MLQRSRSLAFAHRILRGLKTNDRYGSGCCVVWEGAYGEAAC